MTLPARLARHAARFARDEKGSIAVESMLILPILIWAYIGTFVYFDAYRAQSINLKAAYTIGDVLSREAEYITPEFMNSLYALQDVLTNSDQAKRMRITAIRYEAAGNRFVRRWSQTRGGVTAHTQASVNALRANFPEMSDGETAIVTETWLNYAPSFDVGLDPFEFTDLVVTRPRFALPGRFCWNSVNDNGTSATETC